MNSAVQEPLISADIYPAIQLRIGAVWQRGASSVTHIIRNPATGETLTTFPSASLEQLTEVAMLADEAFCRWRQTSPVERGHILSGTASLLRQRAPQLARLLTLEQGKPLAEAQAEWMAAADLLDWFAAEAPRGYGRMIPGRRPGVLQLAVREPVGVVAAFTPWNFPVSQIVRKLGPALAAGCTVILKAPEETPASPMRLIEALIDAGLPAGVVNLVYGVPAEISNFLIPHPTIRKLSFTGSVPVGKMLAALAGQHMKRTTMELGGHGAALIFADADIEAAATTLAHYKYRNAGQVCISPTRFLIERPAYERFVTRFTEIAANLKLGNGLSLETNMGPLVSERRLNAVSAMVDEACSQGAEAITGGARFSTHGYFYKPTVLAGLTPHMRAMQEEPFGPVALMVPFDEPGAAIAEANRLPYGLAAYAWTRSQVTADQLARSVQTGMLTINHLGLGLPELPFGGVKESGYGSEGGTEALDAYLDTKLVTQAFA